MISRQHIFEKFTENHTKSCFRSQMTWNKISESFLKIHGKLWLAVSRSNWPFDPVRPKSSNCQGQCGTDMGKINNGPLLKKIQRLRCRCQKLHCGIIYWLSWSNSVSQTVWLILKNTFSGRLRTLRTPFRKDFNIKILKYFFRFHAEEDEKLAALNFSKNRNFLRNIEKKDFTKKKLDIWKHRSLIKICSTT